MRSISFASFSMTVRLVLSSFFFFLRGEEGGVVAGRALLMADGISVKIKVPCWRFKIMSSKQMRADGILSSSLSGWSSH